MGKSTINSHFQYIGEDELLPIQSIDPRFLAGLHQVAWQFHLYQALVKAIPKDQMPGTIATIPRYLDMITSGSYKKTMENHHVKWTFIGKTTN